MAIQYVRTRPQLHARLRSYVASATRLLSTPPHLFVAEAAHLGFARVQGDDGMHASASLWLREPDLDFYNSLKIAVHRAPPESMPRQQRRGYEQGVAFVSMSASDSGWAWFSLKRAPKFDGLPNPEMKVISDAYRQAMLQLQGRKPRLFTRHPRWMAGVVRRVLLRR